MLEHGGTTSMMSQVEIAKARRALIAAVVVLLVAAALVLRSGPGRGDEATSPEQPAGVTASSGSDAPGGVGGGGAGGTGSGGGSPSTTVSGSTKGGTSGAGGSATTTTTAVAPMPDNNTYEYEVTLSPMCVATGAPLTVTLRLQPGNGAGIIVAYADSQTHGSRYQGYAGPDGQLTRTWPAGTVAGPAYLLTSATDSNGRSGGKRIEFRVVGAGEPC